MDTHSNEAMHELRQRGVLTAIQIAQALGVSRPTVARTISSISRQKILRIGSGKATRYALRRQIREMGSEWPIYNISTAGEIQLVGRLFSLEPNHWYLEQDNPWTSLGGLDFADGLYPCLPWFIQDLRPQGFLGRIFARIHASTLGTSNDPRDWNNDDIFSALVRFGYDLPGSFVIGDEMLRQAQRNVQQPANIMESQTRCAEYPARATAIINDEPAESSAAGEQPKFPASIRQPNGSINHVIVKFSGGSGLPADIRWSDLLIAENTANNILSSIGVPCAETTILQAGGRTFLESVRFDRAGSTGRRGTISLEALDIAFFGAIDTPWTSAAIRLLQDGWISNNDSERLQLLWWFGVLIGNTDMHYGNTSLYLTPNQPLELAPVYDMLPMLYRPNQEGGLPPVSLNPPPPSPPVMHIWTRAVDAATRYWEQLAGEQLLSATFQSIAQANTRLLRQYSAQYHQS